MHAFIKKKKKNINPSVIFSSISPYLSEVNIYLVRHAAILTSFAFNFIFSPVFSWILLAKYIVHYILHDWLQWYLDAYTKNVYAYNNNHLWHAVTHIIEDNCCFPHRHSTKMCAVVIWIQVHHVMKVHISLNSALFT